MCSDLFNCYLVHTNMCSMITKENKKYFNLKAVEVACKIPDGVLRRHLSEKGGHISEDQVNKIELFLSDLTREVGSAKESVANPVDSRKVVKNTVAKVVDIGDKQDTKQDTVYRLPDLNNDGSFNMDKWEIFSIRMCHKEVDLMVSYTQKGEVYFPK